MPFLWHSGSTSTGLGHQDFGSRNSGLRHGVQCFELWGVVYRVCKDRTLLTVKFGCLCVPPPQEVWWQRACQCIELNPTSRTKVKFELASLFVVSWH